MSKDPYNMSRKERKKAQDDAVNNYINLINNANSLDEILVRLYNIYYSEPDNILKFGTNCVGRTATLDHTNALRKVEAAAKVKCLEFMEGKDKNYLFHEVHLTRQGIWILEKLAHKKTSTAMFFHVATKLDKQFSELLANKFDIHYHPTPGLK